MKYFNPDDPIVLSPLMTISPKEAYSLDRVPKEKEQENQETEPRFPSGLQMAKNLSSSILNATKALTKGEKIRSSKGEAAERMKICAGCEHYIKEENRCNLCGCFLNVKTKVATERCPVGKW